MNERLFLTLSYETVTVGRREYGSLNKRLSMKPVWYVLRDNPVVTRLSEMTYNRETIGAFRLFQPSASSFSSRLEIIQSDISTMVHVTLRKAGQIPWLGNGPAVRGLAMTPRIILM